METENNDLTFEQKETCAIITMRDAVAKLAFREGIPYKDALLQFAGSRIYEALFDFETNLFTCGCYETAVRQNAFFSIPG